MNFAALLKSEFRKLTYARSTWWLLAGAIAFATLSTAVMPLILDATTAQVNGVPAPSALMNPDLVDAMFGKAAAGYYFAMILGAMILAGEFAKGTAIATFLAAPARQTVLFAKITVAAIVGLVLQIISATIAAAVGLVVLMGYKHADPHLSAFGDLAITAAISGIVLALVGLAVGALVRNQTVAIVSLLAWMFLIDPILTAVLGSLNNEGAKFLFTALISGMMDLHLSGTAATSRNPLSSIEFFSPLVSVALLVGYAVVLVGAALSTSLRRDID